MGPSLRMLRTKAIRTRKGKGIRTRRTKRGAVVTPSKGGIMVDEFLNVVGLSVLVIAVGLTMVEKVLVSECPVSMPEFIENAERLTGVTW